MILQDKVTFIREDHLDVQDVFKAFIKSHERNSTRTAKEYEVRIAEFFRVVISKETKFVTMLDIEKIKHSHIKMYVSYLTEQGNTDKTIATKLYTLKSFYNDLLKNDLKVNPTIFAVNLKIQKNHHEALTFDELDSLFKFMQEEKAMGLEKYLFLKTLYTTGNRRSATFSLKWSDFKQKRDPETNDLVWIVSTIDKGGKHVEKPISDEFYAELKQLDNGQENVFGISSKTIERALKRFSQTIDKDISMHSMKATGVTLGYAMTKDINLCKQYASHADISTTAMYLREEVNYTKQLSYNMSKELDDDALLEMSHEDLIRFIMDSKNVDIKKSILMRINKG